MNVAVLTFPLINNYGGIIQAYAMMVFLRELGHKPTFINLQTESRFTSFSKYLVKKYILFFLKKHRNVTLTVKDSELKRFVDTYITPQTIAISNSKELHEYFESQKFDACVVGSDQVFSKMGYSNFENDYSLGFLNNEIIKLSYAASFGGSDYQGNQDKVEFHKTNLKRFDAVSVREKSAIDVCTRTFDVDAKHVLDPTMMIDKMKYLEIFGGSSKGETRKELFAYVLDSDLSKTKVVQDFAGNIGLSVNQINDGNGSEKTIPMEDWLKSILYSEHVITDSFHGCVFCIIFNTPFHCFINKKRGADRFYSLLEMFGLENRIISDEVTDAPIDWDDVNNKLELNKIESAEFLREHLKCSEVY